MRVRLRERRWIDRGFYIESFPASALDRVLLKISGRQPGVHVLIAHCTRLRLRRPPRRPGLRLRANLRRQPGRTGRGVRFSQRRGPNGEILTFAVERVAGPDVVLYYDIAAGPCTGAVVAQTEDTTPPLSTWRRDRLGLVILDPESETEMRSWIAVASRADGAAGSRWRTDLMLRNRGSAAAAITLRLHAPSGVASRSLTLDAGEHVTTTDIVNFIAPAFSGSASLEVVGDHPLEVTSRTYILIAASASCFPGGTFGQAYPGMRLRDGFVDGQTAVLGGLAEWSDFRTNLGLSNASQSAAQVVVRLYDDQDTLVHTSGPMTLTPGEWRQLYRPFRELAGRSNVRSGRAEVEMKTGASVLVHASLVDNRTNDAATLWATP